jgi:hypothetical protein
MQSAFQWYDTGHCHVLNNITFRRCISSNPSQIMRTWELLTHSDQFVPENMQVRSGSQRCWCNCWQPGWLWARSACLLQRSPLTRLDAAHLLRELSALFQRC